MLPEPLITSQVKSYKLYLLKLNDFEVVAHHGDTIYFSEVEFVKH